MKKLLIVGLFLLVMLSIGASSQNNVEKLMGIIKSGEIELWRDGCNEKVLRIYENTGKHNHFQTTYKEHFAIVERIGDDDRLTLNIRDYQDYYTIHDARGFILIILIDYNKDGKVDDWRKDYVILLDEYHVLQPFYPPNYLNKNWFKMTRVEAQSMFDQELGYILENIDKAK